MLESADATTNTNLEAVEVIYRQTRLKDEAPKTKKNVNSHITLFDNRCIHCCRHEYMNTDMNMNISVRIASFLYNEKWELFKK